MNTGNPQYLSSEMILSSDKIKYHGEGGEVDFTITEGSPDWNQLSEGAMPKVPSSGNVYVSFSDDNLEFISKNVERFEDNALGHKKIKLLAKTTFTHSRL